MASEILPKLYERRYRGYFRYGENVSREDGEVVAAEGLVISETMSTNPDMDWLERFSRFYKAAQLVVERKLVE